MFSCRLAVLSDYMACLEVYANNGMSIREETREVT
jgi:hypothetical protein